MRWMPERISDEQFARSLAKRVVAVRKLQNLTQAQVAEKLGISQQGLQKYERAQRRIPVSLLPPLAEALNTTVEELLGIAHKNHKRGKISQIEERFQQVGNLPLKTQREILKVIDALLAQAS